jgi:hypothetical protein
VKAYAPTVKRVVITSSFAAIINASKGDAYDHEYSEEDWNPITEEEAVKNPTNGYRGMLRTKNTYTLEETEGLV